MTEQEIVKKYGEPGTNQTMVKLPYPMKLAWDLRQTVRRMQCHEQIAKQVEAIFTEVLAHYGMPKVVELGLDLFGGCLNIRPMRNGTRLSVHCWGLAIDMDPEHNKLKWGKDKARFAKPEYDEFWKIVEKHGGISLGRARNYDWMHFQFIPL